MTTPFTCCSATSQVLTSDSRLSREDRADIAQDNDSDELTLDELARLTGLDACQWREFIARGWLQASQRTCRSGATPVACVTVHSVRSLIKRHPEVLDSQAVCRETRIRLELDSLPDPPRYKRLVCLSFEGHRAQPLQAEREGGEGVGESMPIACRRSMTSCAQEGGTVFWGPIYAVPFCPRCGCAVSAYSADGVYTDADLGDKDVLDELARKLGLRWAQGELRNAEGTAVPRGHVLFHLFACRLNDDRAGGMGGRRLEPESDVDHSVSNTQDNRMSHLSGVEPCADRMATFAEVTRADR